MKITTVNLPDRDKTMTKTIEYFSKIIIEMQIDLLKFKIKYPNATDKIEGATKRIDQLIEIKSVYDKFYFDAMFYRQESADRMLSLIKATETIKENKAEIEKLNKIIANE